MSCPNFRTQKNFPLFASEIFDAQEYEDEETGETVYDKDGAEVYQDHTTSRGKQPTIEAASKMLKRLGTGYQAAITSFDWRRGRKYVCTVR